MKNIFVIFSVVVLVLTTASCSKEKYDLLPGEVQLKSTDFNNDDKMSYEALTQTEPRVRYTIVQLKQKKLLTNVSKTVLPMSRPNTVLI